MSRRLSKRQLRELQELETLGRPEVGGTGPLTIQEGEGESVAEEEDKDEGGEAGGGGGSLFAQLGEVDEAGESSGEETDVEKEGAGGAQATTSKSKKNKKKKKKKPGAGANAPGAADSSDAGTVNRDKATKGTPDKRRTTDAKDSPKTAKDLESMSMDELSALLASQAKLDERSAAAQGSMSALAVPSSSPLPSLRAHLSLSAPSLDPSVELKRQFGAAAIKAYESEASVGAGRGAGSAASASARARSMAWNTNFKVRSILVQPQDTWPPIARTFTGMTMETFDDEKRGKLGGWVHSRAYREAQLKFLQAVQSYEPNHLISLLRLYPWHIDTLLQLSDVSRHQGDLGAASDWNARALFAFERTSTTLFSSSLTSHLGPPLLSFDRIEDRSFWIACHRHINFMGRRGTWRTALEWVKLMLGLDPTNDHHGMILWLDFLSIKSRQHVWFLDCLQRIEVALGAELEGRGEYIVDAKTPFDDDKALVGEGGATRGALDWCLGCAYAKALALRAVEKEEGDKSGKRSTAALRLAIARHPHLLPLLFDKIGLAFPREMSLSPLFALDGVQDDAVPALLAHVYVSRSESLWREADVSAWLLSTLQQAWPTLQQHVDDICRPAADVQSRWGIYRHVIVSDLPDALRQTLIGLIPREITSNSAMLNAYDPIPPRGSNVTRYDDEYFEPVTREHSRREQGQGPAEAGLLNQFMNAMRGVRGLEGWGTAMEDMDDETRQDVMAQILQMTAEARQGEAGEDDMPGTFHTQHEEGPPQAGPGSFAALRQLLGNMWGQERMDAATGTGAVADVDDEDIDDADHVDADHVDE